MRSVNSSSVRNEIFGSSMIFSCVILIVFSAFLANILYSAGMSKAHDIIKQRNYAINYFIDGFFSEINNSIARLADNKDVQNLPWLDPSARERVLTLFKSYTNVNENITYIYSGYENKDLVINDYAPPEGFDPTTRPWYRSAMATKPVLSTGLPYQDIRSKEWLFATSKALLSKEHGYTGVVSSDSSVQQVVDMLQQRGDVYKTSYSYVTNLEGVVLIHHNENYLNKPISDLIGTPVDTDSLAGSFTYTLDGQEKIAYFSRSKETNWVVFTIANKEEITGPIVWQILGCVALTGLISIALGFGQSAFLSRRFSVPLIELREKVKSIIRGDTDNASDYRYPENEIGVIAREVEQLAAYEFYERSKLLEDANRQLEEKNKELERLYVTDWLTGLYNRHKMDDELEQELQRSVRYRKKFALVLFDIDWFKKINDTYGHPGGDSVLRELALMLHDNLRVIEVPCRWGGEEFLILCPEIGLDEAKTLGIRLCSLIENHEFSIGTRVTISVGVTAFTGTEKIHELIKRADDNLYTAKRSGRNTVVAA